MNDKLDADKERDGWMPGALLLFDVFFGYVAIWGVGYMHSEQCVPSLQSLGAELVLAIPLLYITVGAIATLAYLCLGKPQGVRPFIAGPIGYFKRFYKAAPTLTVIAVVVLLATLYGMYFRYHTFSREDGFYMYDRLLHHGQFYAGIDCPQEEPE